MQTSRSGSALEMLLDGGVFCEFLPIAQIDAEEKHPLPRGKWSPDDICPCNHELQRPYALHHRRHRAHLLNRPVGNNHRRAHPRLYKRLRRGSDGLHTDRALEHACAEHRCTVRDYHVYPVFADTRSVAHHQWIVEWDTPPADEDAFMSTLDLASRTKNSDYQAKRQSSIFLNLPASPLWRRAPSTATLHPPAASEASAKCPASPIPAPSPSVSSTPRQKPTNRTSQNKP